MEETAMARKPTDMVQLKVRLPETLRWQMEHAAKQNDRSMNAEIVARLNRSLQRDEDKIEGVAEALLASLDPAIVDKMMEIVSERLARDYDFAAEKEAQREEAELAKQEKDKGSK
jgi:hypothetical protein